MRSITGTSSKAVPAEDPRAMYINWSPRPAADQIRTSA